MESHRHVQVGAHETHEFSPERGGEHRITVGHHGLQHAVEAYNVGEEGLRHELYGVRVSQGDEVVVLAKAINHRQYDRLPPHEVEADVDPDGLRYRKGHEEAGWM